MNAWDYFLITIAACLVPAGVGCLRGKVPARFIALMTAQVIAAEGMIAFATRTGAMAYVDVALTLSILSLATGLVFARLLERWL